MKKVTKCLVFLLALCLFTVPALAVSGMSQKDGITIDINGERLNPVDANGNAVEPFAIDGTTYVPVRALSEALGYDVIWNAEQNSINVVPKSSLKADDMIKDVIVLTFVDVDGVKAYAVAVEYAKEIAGSSVSAEDYEVRSSDVITDSPIEIGANPGKVLKAYVNDVPETAKAGKNSGKYVILELNTDFLRSGISSVYTSALIADVTQKSLISTTDGEIVVPSSQAFRNYESEEYEHVSMRGTHEIKIRYNLKGDYVIDGLDKFELHYKTTDAAYDPAYPAFQATNCFEEATGESVDLELPYALYVPEDYDASKKYGLVLHIHDAGGLGDDPVTTLTEAQGLMNYASDEIQQYAKDQGLAGLIVVGPEIPTEYRTARDNYTTSAAVGATWQLLDYLTRTYNIDENRIYASGQSMGGMQVIAMAAQRDNYFAGIWEMGCQWGNNYNKEEPYPDNSGNFPVYYQSTDSTITSPDYGRNWFYLISDDNILCSNCTGDMFSSTTWAELKYLYQDIAGVEIPYTAIDPLNQSVDEQNAALEALVAQPNELGIYWQAFNGGNHNATWLYTHRLHSGYKWLLSQTKESEDTRGKLEGLNRPWAAETDPAKIAEKQTEDRKLGNSDYYFAVPAEGAGTIGYNSAWLGMDGGPVDDVHLAGWAPTSGK